MKRIVDIQTKKVKIFDKDLSLGLDVQYGFVLGFLIGAERYKSNDQTTYDLFIALPFLAITFTIARKYNYEMKGGII